MPLELGAVAAIAKEVGNLDKIISNLFSIDYIFKDAISKRALRTFVD